ncbi:ABC transporter permease [Schaalia vaccimaxillae]|uniref:ABC transporter permease n=1 Tax=Schaalia vaccimaxillae TaxID=183916 RepID=UPI0003B44C95|nr:ABC transporter permease [Schaalia vaccimaxillae]
MMTSFATAVCLEIKKMRRLWVWPIALALVGAGLALSAPSSQSTVAKAEDPWPSLLLVITLTTAIISPILVAVLASRLTEVEHVSGGWTMSAAAGLAPGRLCRAKLVALSSILIPVVILTVGVPMLTLHALGPAAEPNFNAWGGYALALLCIDLVACGLHILVSAIVENQIVGIGVGFLGSFIAVFSLLLPPWLARLIPWGYWALITPVMQVGDLDAGTQAVVYTDVAWWWIAGFCLLGMAIFGLVTARLNRIER